MPETTAEYYARRAQEARAMAEKSQDPCARQSHWELADQYERMADGKLVELGIVERG